jgi:hypothetical protein
MERLVTWRHALCVLAAYSALSLGAARAGDIDCAWKAISPAARADIAERFHREGLAQAKSYRLPLLDLEHLSDQCVRDGASLEVATVVLFFHAMRDDLAGRLLKLGLDPAAANADWKSGLTPAGRADFRRYLEDRDVHRPLDAAEQGVVDHLLGQPYVDEAIRGSGQEFATKQTLLDYDLALARTEEVEARF